MREAAEGERALGCPDRGLMGGFASGVLRWLKAGRGAEAPERSWALAALSSYRIKNAAQRDEVCVRLETVVPSQPVPAREGLPLTTPLTAMTGVGEQMARHLAAMGLHTLGDLLDHLPRDWIDRRLVTTISDLRIGQEATILATVKESTVDRFRTGRRAARIVVVDASRQPLVCIFWNQEWRAKSLPAGTHALFSGKVDSHRGRLQMASPAVDIVGSENEPVHTARVVPVYPATEKVSAIQLRRLVHSAFERVGDIPDPLPAAIRASANLLGRDHAYRLIHFPESPEQAGDARRRLVFDELFTLEVGLALRKRHLEAEVRGISHEPDGDLTKAFLDSLPFRPTGAQARSMGEIARDMAAPRPMHRLLQGEVGSGKTLVAVYAACVAAQSGTQAAVMAPTEVLAEQHARRVREFLEPVGVEVGLVTSSVPSQVRRDIVMRLGAGDLKVVCGTHALLSEDVGFARLGLAIVDEQHRFGLGQRMHLREKGTDPDVLIMTATPIPRTLALTLYGDLDVSVLDELPSGRLPIRTSVASTAAQREKAYELVRTEVAAGHRAFVVCALVEESDALQAKAAVDEAERLRTEVFPDLQVGLLHGQMRSQEKDRVMDAFRRGDISVLISTTVIEVGVDVPEATVMLIEDAERFGLSQLHQLRGRVGRGAHGGWCILFSTSKTPEARRRLEAVAATNDGFALAEEDLRIRGEGTIFGLRQAGMTDLKLARLVEDFPIVVEARGSAFELVDADPRLERPEHRLLREEVGRRFGDALDWLFRG